MLGCPSNEVKYQDASWGTTNEVKDTVYSPMNVVVSINTPNFQGYQTLAACSQDKATDILILITGVLNTVPQSFKNFEQLLSTLLKHSKMKEFLAFQTIFCCFR